ncbi:PepSY-associated TM helix domain-containing protein [Microbulbifer litoralis]|uniref:PepSY-associated TM helix domain-containing protein n=1 Tax=Microbulbifer litoralis TaxID=2933965 RepID=UPI002027A1C6|nr:PepSY-associated TM helix domain-containing protein [Microbulbifer sp. GX H0434]
MKTRFRAAMAQLHRWAGILFSAMMFFIFLTGTVGYFHYEIDRWMEPERPLAMDRQASASDPTQTIFSAPSAGGRITVTQAELVELGFRRLHALAIQDAIWWGVILPTGRNGNTWIEWQPPRRPDGHRPERRAEYLSFADGEPQWIRPRHTGGGEALYRLHWKLHYLPETAAYWIVGLCTLLMLVGLVSGVIIHRKIFRDFFTLRLFRSSRSWLDLHNITSVMSLPFQLMIVYSGLIFFAVTFMTPIVTAQYGEDGARTFYREAFPEAEAEPKTGTPAHMVPVVPLLHAAQAETKTSIGQLYLLYPGDKNARLSFYLPETTPGHYRGKPHKILYRASTGERLEGGNQLYGGAASVEKTLIALHEGLFADWRLRWLYIFSGLLGVGMIGTGAIYWLRKRQARDRQSFAAVERFYAAVLVGLPIGIAAYFCANRLIPAHWSERADWEMHCLFLAWMLTFAYTWLRPLERIWRGLLLLAATAWSLVPLVNAVTSNRHLGISLANGDRVLAGFDLSAIAVAIAFGLLAIYGYRRAYRSNGIGSRAVAAEG